MIRNHKYDLILAAGIRKFSDSQLKKKIVARAIEIIDKKKLSIFQARLVKSSNKN